MELEDNLDKLNGELNEIADDEDFDSLEIYKPSLEDLEEDDYATGRKESDIDTPKQCYYQNLAQVFRNGKLYATVTDDRTIFYHSSGCGEIVCQLSWRDVGFLDGLEKTLGRLIEDMFIDTADHAPNNGDTLELTPKSEVRVQLYHSQR